jgi:hypothetical protein
MKEKSNDDPEINSKSKDLYRSINEYKKGCQPRTN